MFKVVTIAVLLAVHRVSGTTSTAAPSSTVSGTGSSTAAPSSTVSGTGSTTAAPSSTVSGTGSTTAAPSSSSDACPGFFGGVNPATMVITDASTPGSFLANLTNLSSLNITAPVVFVHYFPGVNETPSVASRKAAFGSMYLSNKTTCIMPGAPIVGQCGKYRKVEYASNCTFNKTANLTSGVIDADAAYTVRGSSVEASGVIKGCEDKIVKSTLYCYRRNASTASMTQPPPEVNCSVCSSQLVEGGSSSNSTATAAPTTTKASTGGLISDSTTWAVPLWVWAWQWFACTAAFNYGI